MKPTREHSTSNQQTYFVTSSTANRQLLFRDDRWAKLFLEIQFHYRQNGYLLHEFVLMHDHFHLMITPKTSLEKAVQFVKGGFSFRAKKEFQFHWDIWQRGFADHRVRDVEDYAAYKNYIYQNPVKKGYVSSPGVYPYSSAKGKFKLDQPPQWLKPLLQETSDGTAKAVPFQNTRSDSTAKAVPFQSETSKSEMSTKQRA